MAELQSDHTNHRGEDSGKRSPSIFQWLNSESLISELKSALGEKAEEYSATGVLGGILRWQQGPWILDGITVQTRVSYHSLEVKSAEPVHMN